MRAKQLAKFRGGTGGRSLRLAKVQSGEQFEGLKKKDGPTKSGKKHRK